MKTLLLPSIFLFVISLMITITSCEKDELNKLPSETMSGRNTFGCLVNGESFTPRKTALKFYLSCIYYSNSNRIHIYTGDNKYLIHMFIYNPKIGYSTELIDTSGFFNSKTSILFGSVCTDENQLIDLSKSYVNISRFDLDENIISGTFNIEITCNSEKINITEGRFDLTFSIF